MRILLLLSLFLSPFLRAQTLNTPKVHAHNDYAQERPFWAAYEAGAYSIEVDLFLKDSTLFVTHTETDITDATQDLERLYLNPLQQEFERKTLRPLQLLLDLKSEALATLAQLLKVLERYDALVHSGKISWVISGNRPPASAYLNYPDFLRFDYQTLDGREDPKIWEKVALISLPFYRYGSWDGVGALPETERKALQEAIAKAHRFGKPFRFWATPDTELSWRTFAELGMDFINTDRPSECMALLKGQ